MAALFRVRIKQLEVKAISVFFRAGIQLCLHFLPYGLDLYKWNPDLTTQGLHKKTPNKQTKH